MRPRLRVDLALGPLLDPVVAHGRGGVQACPDVLIGELDDESGPHRVVCPHTGVAVGLQLQPHRAALRPLPVAADPLHGAEQVLDVMAVLVADDVRLCERPALRAELRTQLLEEAEVEVDLLVTRAVERPDRGAGGTAAGLRTAAEQLRARRAVALPAAGEGVPPVGLDAAGGVEPPRIALGSPPRSTTTSNRIRPAPPPTAMPPRPNPPRPRTSSTCEASSWAPSSKRMTVDLLGDASVGTAHVH